MLDGRVQDMAYAYTGQKLVCMDIARGQSVLWHRPWGSGRQVITGLAMHANAMHA